MTTTQLISQQHASNALVGRKIVAVDGESVDTDGGWCFYFTAIELDDGTRLTFEPRRAPHHAAIEAFASKAGR